MKINLNHLIIALVITFIFLFVYHVLTVEKIKEKQTGKLIKRDVEYIPITITFVSSGGVVYFSTVTHIRIKEYRIITQ